LPGYRKLTANTTPLLCFIVSSWTCSPVPVHKTGREKQKKQRERETRRKTRNRRKHQGERERDLSFFCYLEPKPEMGFAACLFSFLFLLTSPGWVCGNPEVRALMEVKAALDPRSRYLSSWTINGDPCGGSFEGVACNERGQVANISLQGRGLSGSLSPAISGLRHLTGLYLHYNSLHGEIPKEISNLIELSDLYLNVNNLSGEIPPQIGKMAGLQG
jgi:hypothetical protein